MIAEDAEAFIPVVWVQSRGEIINLFSSAALRLRELRVNYQDLNDGKI